MDNLRLVVVDDDPDFGVMMRKRLTKEIGGLDARVFTSGRDCLDYLLANEADCVISDYQMPGMSGIDLLDGLREKGNEVPFIFVTGQGSEEVARDAFKRGAFDYFTKDLGRLAYFTRLANSVGKAVRQKKMEYDALKRLAAEAAGPEGGGRFDSRIRYLAGLLKVEYAFVGRYNLAQQAVDTISVFAHGETVPNFTYSVLGTPCENVVKKWACCYPRDVQSMFPQDALLVEMGVEGYAGVPLYDTHGNAIGILVVLGTRPLDDEEIIKSILMMFAARFSVELEGVNPSGS